ncbi:FimV family protein [Pigmentiphaga litoralis]|uniref:type IV pilus assembly protein FimV n=1 Tax=Pigmentiphaga litoralis TaxID=516702 RepID=UPI003B4309C0
MLRPAWLLSLSLVFTSASGAADLGPLRVLSASGDPLRAEIEISAFTPEEATTLQVNLASADIYREAKVAYPEGLSSLTLKVADRPNGRKVVEVVSAGPVDAHVLDLLVEVTWHQGRYIRQYSFVLKSPPAESRAPVVSSAAVPPTLVQPGDTLFDLATRLRPEGATVFQTLLALFHANPQSFIDGNMNLLRAGTTLQVPPASQVLAESDSQARQTLRTQNESFALYRERVAQAAAVATPIEATPPPIRVRARLRRRLRNRPRPTARAMHSSCPRRAPQRQTPPTRRPCVIGWKKNARQRSAPSTSPNRA